MNQETHNRIVWIAKRWQVKDSWKLVYQCSKEFLQDSKMAGRLLAAAKTHSVGSLPFVKLEQHAKELRELADAKFTMAFDSHHELLELADLMREHAPALLELVPQPDFFDPPPVADISNLILNMRKLEGAILAMDSSNEGNGQLRLSTTDRERWEFAKPYREKPKPVVWKTIADLWRKQSGEVCDEPAMKQSCHRAKKLERNRP